MSEKETVNYRAQSVLTSRTMWFNVLTLALSVLSMTEVQNVLTPAQVAMITGTVLPIGNMILRFYTVRPVAILDQTSGGLLAPNASTPMAVKKLA